MSVEDGPKGIDISKWQSTTPPLTGLDFVIARASIGTTKDPMYATHIANARKAGLLVGAYHFNWSTLSVASQVKTFLEAAGDVDFYFIDVEYAGNGVSQFSKAQTRDFIAGVRAAGKTCGLYMSQSGYYTDVANDYRWVARWGTTPPSIGWKFWQYQGSPLDKNRFNGTLAQLEALAGSTGDSDMPQKAITSTEPKLIRIIKGQDIFDLDGVTKLADSAFERTDVFSPVQRGTVTIDGVPKRFREWYVDLDGSGSDPKRSVLCKVDDSNIKPVPAPEPCPECPECPPGDCSAVEAELATAAALLNTVTAERDALAAAQAVDGPEAEASRAFKEAHRVYLP